MDDEKSVRDLIRLMLEPDGYEVHVADGGKAAIQIASAPELLIDIVITDILMPRMNGKDLANRIAAMKPSIKVLFISAYTAEILSTHNLYPDGTDIIRKPFTKEALLDRIGRVWASSPKWKELVSKSH